MDVQKIHCHRTSDSDIFKPVVNFLPPSWNPQDLLNAGPHSPFVDASSLSPSSSTTSTVSSVLALPGGRAWTTNLYTNNYDTHH